MLSTAALVSLTLIYGWAGYSVASDRIDECIELIVSVEQSDICIRSALEARDSSLAWTGAALLLTGALLVFGVRSRS